MTGFLKTLFTGLTAIILVAVLLTLGYFAVQAMSGWPYLATLSSLFLISASLLILMLAIHKTLTLEFENHQSLAARMGEAIFGSIRSVLMVNNGWFVVFLTMALLSFGIAFYTQFNRPPLVDQALITQEQAANKDTSTQKMSHALLDWDLRKDTKEEKAAVQADVKEYQLQFPDAMYAWPWWSCFLIMLGVTILSIPFVLSDEAAEVWQHVRQHNAGAPQGDELAHQGGMTSFFDRLFHHTNTPSHAPATPISPAAPQQPTGQPAGQTPHAPMFGQLLLMDFFAGLLSKITEDLFTHQIRH